MNNPAKQAFKDMQSMLNELKAEQNNRTGIAWLDSSDNYLATKSHVFTSESKKLNRDLGITYINNYFSH